MLSLSRIAGGTTPSESATGSCSPNRNEEESRPGRSAAASASASGSVVGFAAVASSRGDRRRAALAVAAVCRPGRGRPRAAGALSLSRGGPSWRRTQRRVKCPVRGTALCAFFPSRNAQCGRNPLYLRRPQSSSLHLLAVDSRPPIFLKLLIISSNSLHTVRQPPKSAPLRHLPQTINARVSEPKKLRDTNPRYQIIGQDRR